MFSRATKAAIFGAMSLGALGASQSTFCDSKFARSFSKEEFRDFAISAVEDVSKDSKVIVLDVPDQEKTSVSSFLAFQVPGCNDEKGAPFTRPYTPIDASPKDGKMVFVVKGYENGNLSKCLTNLKPGDTVAAKGPFPKFAYEANKTKNIVLIGGGSGVTPMFQLMFEILQNPQDKTQVTFISAHSSEDSIILKSLLDLMNSHEQLTVHQVLSRPEASWKGQTGRLTLEMAQNLMPPATNDTFVCVCGPPKFYEDISGAKGPNYTQGEVGGILAQMGFNKDQVFKI